MAKQWLEEAVGSCCLLPPSCSTKTVIANHHAVDVLIQAWGLSEKNIVVKVTLYSLMCLGIVVDRWVSTKLRRIDPNELCYRATAR